MAVDFDFCQRVAKADDRFVGARIRQHFFRAGVGRHVVDQRNALVEEVASPRLDIPPRAIVGNPTPLETGDEFTGHRIEVFEEQRTCC